MQVSFQKAEWIWSSDSWGKDEYSRFRQEFTGRGSQTENTLLTIVAEGNYTAYLNGVPVSSGQYCGYPDYKYADQIALTGFVKEGKNEFEVLVWYYGEDTSGYIDDGPGVIFEITQGGLVMAASSGETQSAPDPHFQSGLCKKITGQLGYSFHYISGAPEPEFGESVPRCGLKPANILPRPVRILKIGAPHESKLVRQEGTRYLYDLGEETAGFLDLSLKSDRPQKLLISYGEHIADGWVRRMIGGRDFSVEYTARAGQNTYCNRMRRLALRYLELQTEEPVEIERLTLKSTDYPLEVLPWRPSDPMQRRIYEVSVRTLQLCMHEHYEDCPWREQALYTMDSRNQMLCGYYAFEEYEFPRANLLLIAKGTREDGLLELTYPARNTPAIPFFSLVYPMQVCEYVEYSGDVSILPEVMPVIDGIMRVFAERAVEIGLIANLPAPYWNFYEWSEHNSEGEAGQYDLILNCMFLISAGYYRKLKAYEREEVVLPDTEAMKERIRERFFDPERGLFFAGTGSHTYSVLGNSLAVLAGIGGEEIVLRIFEGQGKDVDPITLSMAVFWYDALLTFGDRYKNKILEDIDRKYGAMLAAGATTFWETDKGEADFDKAGSLCHGWSATPVYYYQKLLNGVKIQQ